MSSEETESIKVAAVARQEVQEELPKNNLLLLIPSLMVTMFLVAINGTLLATALPTINGDLGATSAEYTWMGTGYLLGLTVVAPFIGRLSDIYGRKPLLHVCMALHLLSSGLAGGSRSMIWLISARTLQGVAGGGIQALLSIVMADIIPLGRRGLYQGYMSAVWTAAAVVGPVLGGAFADAGQWRWCFWINIPACGLGWVAFTFTLHLKPRELRPARKIFGEFDFAGVALLSIGSALLNVGFAQAANDGIASRYSYPYIAAGGALLVAGVINCRITSRKAVIPRKIFRTRTPLILLTAACLNAMAFIPTLYLLPQLFQGVRGSSPLGSGLQNVPYEASLCFSGIIGGQLNSRLKWTRSLIWVSVGGGALGYGLFYGVFQYPFGLGPQIVVELVAGFFLGLGTPSSVLLQASMPVTEMASSMAAVHFVRMIGGGVGFSATEALLNRVLASKFSSIPGYGSLFVVPQSTTDYAQIIALPEPLQTQVLVAFSNGLGYCWIWSMACAFLSLLLCFGLKDYCLDRKEEEVVRASPAAEGVEESLEVVGNDIEMETQSVKCGSSNIKEK